MKALNVVSLALCLGGMLSGCAAAERAMPRTLSDANVISVLDTIDVSEIEAAQLAKQKSSSPALRSFAASLVDQHTENMQQTLQLANRMRVQPEKPRLAFAMETTHRETMERLGTKSGPAFDRAYLDYQVRMHQQAVELVEDTVNSVDDTMLRQRLSKMRPELLNHLTAARDLQRQLVAQQAY